MLVLFALLFTPGIIPSYLVGQDPGPVQQLLVR